MVDSIRENRALPSAPADEDAIVRYVMELVSNHKVSDATYKTAIDQFGVKNLVELTSLVGMYVTNSFLINAFEFDLPSDVTEAQLPIPS